jgi:hypothetical protein
VSSQATAASPDGRRLRIGLAPAGERYGLLLTLLVGTYVLSAFVGGRLVNALQIVLFVVTLLLAMQTAQVPRRTARIMIAVVFSGSVVALVLAAAVATRTAAGIADLWTALVLLLTVVMIVARILAKPVITLHSILGAISAYLIIGLMFACCYRAIGRLASEPFFANHAPGTVQLYQYFSFTTLTTLGYGDFTAGSSGGRAIAALEALAGQIFLATLIARLVAAFRSPRRSAAEEAAGTQAHGPDEPVHPAGPTVGADAGPAEATAAPPSPGRPRRACPQQPPGSRTRRRRG